MSIRFGAMLAAGIVLGAVQYTHAQPFPSISTDGFGVPGIEGPPVEQPSTQPLPFEVPRQSEPRTSNDWEKLEEEIGNWRDKPQIERPQPPSLECCIVNAPCCGSKHGDTPFEPISLKAASDARQFCRGLTPQEMASSLETASPSGGSSGGCTNPFDWPAETVEEICLRRNDAFVDRCGPASRALITFRQFDRDAGGVEYYFELARIATCRGLSQEDARVRYLQLTREYNANCLDRIDEGAVNFLNNDRNDCTG